MPLRPCLGLPTQSCGRLTDRADSRCPTCASARERGRGNRHQRGYDASHVATRDRLLPDAIGKPCPRCGEPMIPDPSLPGLGLDLGHPDDAPLRLDRTSRADRIEHAHCNRGARD